MKPLARFSWHEVVGTAVLQGVEVEEEEEEEDDEDEDELLVRVLVVIVDEVVVVHCLTKQALP